jgi:Zn-finger nucleic acid-binding protein
MSSPSAQTLKCPNCGAPAASGTAACEYCRARLATVSCPSCFGLLFEGASFCQHCGAPRSSGEVRTPHRSKCPACNGHMAWVKVGDADLLECDACEGTWLEAATFERICADRESQAALLHQSREPAATTGAATAPVRYRPCLRCGKMMNRVNFGKVSGAVVDVCKGHGTFLDRGELHQIVRFIQNGGIDRARAIEREEIVEERRRLQDVERAHARLAPMSSSSTLNDAAINGSWLREFLSALLGPV